MVLCAMPLSAFAANGWEIIDREDGIVVSVKEVEGRALPIFKGRAMVEAPILEVLAVLDDTDKRSDWVKPCIEAKTLKFIDDYNRVVYDRTAAPWPVSDRDVVVRSKVVVDLEKKSVHVGFHSDRTSTFPVPDGVVRMTRLKGFYHLVHKGDEKTEVTYQIDTDPAGMLPDWLIRLVSREIPKDTLGGLRRQVAKTWPSGVYGSFVAKWTALQNEAQPEEGASEPERGAPPVPAPVTAPATAPAPAPAGSPAPAAVDE